VIPLRELEQMNNLGVSSLPREETVKLCQVILQDPKFFQLLYRIDQELAAQARAGRFFLE
jgi:hypothetical protein